MNKTFFMSAVLTLALCAPALADDSAPISLTLKDHKFTPAEIHVKANTPTVLVITNQDSTSDEFDSTSLKVEKVIAGNAQGTVHLRALDPGRYPFMGEYHSDTAQGVVIVQ